MSANSTSTFTTEHIAKAQGRILDEINKTPFIPSAEREEGKGPLLTYIQAIYDERMQTPNERAELSQMQRAARFVSINNGEKTTRDCQEFFCGEIFATEFVAYLIGTRKGTGDLAQMAMSGFLEIDRPDGESSENRLEVEGRHEKLAYSLQEKLTSPGGLLPPDFEALLDTLVLEKETRTILSGQLSARDFDSAYPKFFVMGFRMVVNEAIASGMLESAYQLQTTRTYNAEEAARNKFYGKPDAETLFDGTPVPTDEALDTLFDNSFESSDYFLISDDRMTLVEQHEHIMAHLRATLPHPEAYDESTIETVRKKAGAVLTTFAREKKLLNTGDMMSSQGNQYVLITNSIEAIAKAQSDEELRTDRHFINSNHEIRGEYVGMEVIGMPDATTLKKMLKNKRSVDPNDEAHHTLFVPAIRLKNPTVTQQDDDGGFEATLGLGEEIELVIPIIYPNVFLAKFMSSFKDETDQNGDQLEA